MLRWCAIASVVVGVGCSSSDAPPPASPLQGATAAPTTGEAPAGPTDAQLHEARVKSVLAKASLDGSSEIARWGAAPLVEARVELDKATFEGRWTWSAVNTEAAPWTSVSFDMPVNRKASGAVVLKSVKVDGAVVSAAGTTDRWDVPVAVAPGKRVEIELVFAGTVPRIAAVEPEVPGPGANPGAAPVDIGKLNLQLLIAQLQGDADLKSLVPVVAVVDGAAAFGQHGAVTVLAGCLPVTATPGVVSLEAVAGPSLEVDATGRRVGNERDGARTKHRFMALGAREVAVVTTRSFKNVTTIEADVSLTLRGGKDLPAALGAQVRRALEDYQTRWGAGGPDELVVIAVDSDVVAALPGIVLVPDALLDAPDPDASAGGRAPDPASPSAGRTLSQSLSLSGLLTNMVAHHPAAREAMTFALATAIAQQWWLGAGADDATDNALRQGLARAGALQVVAGKNGDKAQRRALEFGLKLPVQLALDKGQRDVALAGVGANNDEGTRRFAALKAGLFFEALARHLGDETMAALAKQLEARPIAMTSLRDAIIAVAPRPEETRAFLVKWLDETHLAQEVGALRPEVLLEYFVTDGAVGSLTSQLLGQLGPNQLGGKALELLSKGQDLDAGMALSLLGELAGDQLDPSFKKWLTLGTGLVGGGEQRKQAIDGLVDELGAKLGIPEHDRSRLRQLSTLLIDQLSGQLNGQLGKDDPAAPPNEPAPVDPPTPANPPAPQTP